MFSKIKNIINDAYCFCHISILKFASKAFFENEIFKRKNISIRILKRENSDEILELLQNHLPGDEEKSPIINWKIEQLKKSFKYSFFTGMFLNDQLISVARIFMHHWYTAEITFFIHKDFRNKLYGRLFLFQTGLFIKKLFIKNLHIIAYKNNLRVTKLKKLNHIDEIYSDNEKVVLNIELKNVLEGGYENFLNQN